MARPGLKCGETYELSNSQAASLIAQGVVVECVDVAPKPKVKAKSKPKKPSIFKPFDPEPDPEPESTDDE
jgi:hypothetical protein